ncbi:MAG: RagB/SusD family nutrient uptake outer membrane protein [Mucilaginibacter sp.]|uniref:RagB/SusD family nutrient uptake outer membrane protein n=1 Tax=Mucilaginibacter sp. TaxID=1882438 RepID=UPI003265799C
MKIKYSLSKLILTCFGIPTLILSSSCNKFVELDAPLNKIEASAAYSTDGTATASVIALYNYGIFNSLNAMLVSINVFGGISSDELHYTPTATPELTEIENNAISIASVQNGNLWAYAYSELLEANAAIDGITASTTLTPSVKSQLLGEAKFFRAFVNFYLVNYYGGVPITSGDPLASAYLPRSTPAQVYALIVSDLKDAQGLLPVTYVGTLKSRVNQYAATALLARVYLYQQDYVNAEAAATTVIGSGVYTLAATNSVFINTSTETILQFATYYGYSAVSTSYRTSTSATNIAPPAYVLTSNIANSFEANDNRKTNWVDSTVSGSKFYRINKYKIYTAATAGAGNEFNVVLRLAELYLIRAEARAQQNNLNNLTGALADVNVIRTRAGLANLPTTTLVPVMLAAIAKERKLELFGEFGHRWFDLLRTGQANTVLSVLKPTTWDVNRSVLFPIPDQQRRVNTSLTQNPGY